MTCTVCGKRPARRACPALRQEICSVCCGTKRQVEISCPDDCQYLVTARAHPAAVVRRQHEDDLRAFVPTVQHLNQRQEELMSRVLLFLHDRPEDQLVRTTDADIEAAAGAMAGTFETAARGLIYEQRPSSLPALRLTADLKAFLAQITQEGGSSVNADLAVVFRAIERGAREARKTLPGGDSAYIGLVARLTPALAGAEAGGHRAGGSPLVQSGGSLLVRP